MRASTLFGLTIAILIGMAVVFGVKSAGFFDRKVEKAPPPDRPRILVAAKNMYEGVHATEGDVMIRAVEDHEMDQFVKNRHKYMPPVTAAAHLREVARNIPANEPLLKEHFKDIGLPPSFYSVLEPMHRAINLQLPKDRAGGGIIRKDDMVDVYLTTTVCADPNCRHPLTLTAPIALGLKVVFKRDSIFNIMQPVADGPISLTLQARPYRAALIEFAKNKGVITVVPTGPDNKKKAFVFVNEGKDEERRDIEQLQGRPISDVDLEEIFRLQPIPRQQQQYAATSEPWRVEIFGGVNPRGVRTFHKMDEQGNARDPYTGVSLPAGGVPAAQGAPQFGVPQAGNPQAGNPPQGGVPVGVGIGGQTSSIGGQQGGAYFSRFGNDEDSPRVAVASRDGQPSGHGYIFRQSPYGADAMSSGYGGAAKKECKTCGKKAPSSSY